MKHLEKSEEIRYVASQIYERFRDRNYWTKKELRLKKYHQKAPNSIYSSSNELNYSVSYSNPGITLYSMDITTTPNLAEYYELFIIEAHSKPVITIRHSPLFREGVRMLGKLASLNRKVNIRKSIENNPSLGGKKNLIIIDDNSDIEEIALQIGIYFYRQGLADKWAVHELFQKVLKRLEQIYDPTEAYDLEKIFDKLVERYRLPNNAKSFQSYLKILLHELRREIFKEGNELFDVPCSTIYRWIREKNLSVPKLNGKYEWNKVDIVELDKLKRRRELRGTWTALIKEYSKKRKVSFESAKRNLKRWKHKGLSFKEMAQRINNVSEYVSN